MVVQKKRPPQITKKRPSRPLRNPNADTSSARPKKVAAPENPKSPGRGRKKRSPPQRAKTRSPLSNPPAKNLAPRGPGNDSTLTSRSKIKGEKAIFAKNFPASRNLCLKSGKNGKFPDFPRIFPDFWPKFREISIFWQNLRFWLFFRPAWYGERRFRASGNPAKIAFLALF